MLLSSTVVRVYCYSTHKVLQRFFMLIFDLELITLEKGKNVGIRPLFGQNRRLGGVLFRQITVSTEVHLYLMYFIIIQCQVETK